MAGVLVEGTLPGEILAEDVLAETVPVEEMLSVVPTENVLVSVGENPTLTVPLVETLLEEGLGIEGPLPEELEGTLVKPLVEEPVVLGITVNKPVEEPVKAEGVRMIVGKRFAEELERGITLV